MYPHHQGLRGHYKRDLAEIVHMLARQDKIFIYKLKVAGHWLLPVSRDEISVQPVTLVLALLYSGGMVYKHAVMIQHKNIKFIDNKSKYWHKKY